MDGKTILVDNRLKRYVDSEEDFDFEAAIGAEQIETEEFHLPDLNSLTYQDLKETVTILCDLAFKVFFVGYGILQFFAISSGLLKIFHHDGIFTLLISSILAFLPVVGSILGVWGACTSWGWNIWNAIIIFALPYVIIHGPMFMIILCESYKDIKRWQEESTFRQQEMF